MLELTILVENSTKIDLYLAGEPGLSVWLECCGRKILFDTGYSGLFLQNAAQLGVDVSQMDMLVYSHGHNDHTWGTHALVEYLDKKNAARAPALLAHPRVFENKRAQGHLIGAVMREEALSAFFDVVLSAEPLEIEPELWWLGEIPASVTPRRASGTICGASDVTPDLCVDDSALAYRGRDGLVIITGCSHSGICNIVAHAKSVTGETRVADIIGGFHLLDASAEELQEVTAYLSAAGVSTMHPCHCTDFKAKMALAAAFDVREAYTGLRLKYK